MPKPNPIISDHMRKLQRKGAKKRWANLSPEQRSDKMKAVRSGKKAPP